MAFELDHLFIVVPPGAVEGERLVAAGLREGSPNVHPGQGTRNRRFFFTNAMLELIWIEDEADARGELVAPTRLWERSRWRETGASPFGVCLRAIGAGDAPFPTWPYAPPYLPAGVEIAIAADTPAHEPMLFVNPLNTRPADYPPERREPLDHPAGMLAISAARVTVAGDEPPSNALAAVERLGIVSVARGAEPLLELTFDAERPAGLALDLRPDLPLVLRW